MYYLLAEIVYKDGSTSWLRDEDKDANTLLNLVNDEYDGVGGDTITSCFAMITKDKPVLSTSRI